MRTQGRARRAAPWLLGWALLATALWGLDMAAGLELTDQSWFQQLLERVGGGEALYGDVFYGVPPLAVWVALPWSLLTGGEVAALKAVNAGLAAATALVAVHCSGRLGVGVAGRALVGAAAVAYLTVPSVTPYNPLASLFLLVALDAAVIWLDASATDGPGSRAARLALASGGAAAGLAACSKQTIGLAALAALLLSVALLGARPRADVAGRSRDAGLLLAVAAAAMLLPLVPVALTGSLGDMWAYAFQKGEYVRSASLSYLDGLDQLGVLIADPGRDERLLLAYVAFAIPPLALAALVAAARRDPGRALLLGSFLIAALVPALPRAGFYQVGFVIPVAGVCLGWALGELAPGVPRPARIVAVGALGAALAATLALAHGKPGLDLRDLEARSSNLPHMRGPVATVATERALDELGDGLAAADGGEGRTMVLGPMAGAAYLVSGIANPTPHDYPLNTAVRSDHVELIERIERGEIQRVCLGAYYPAYDPLAPDELIAYVRASMRPAQRIGVVPGSAPVACRIYERAPPG